MSKNCMTLKESSSALALQSHADMLSALAELTQGVQFTSAEAVRWAAAGQREHQGPEWMLSSAVLELMGRTQLSNRSMGRLLLYRCNQTVAGRKLLARSTSGPFRLWRVVPVFASI